MPARSEANNDLGLTPASLRRANERTLIDLLTRLRKASRADLAKASGLSQPTTGKIVQRLVRMGAIREARLAGPDDTVRGGTAPGRPGRLVEFNPDTPRFLAVHLDVTETSVALLPFNPHCPERWPVRFATGRGLDQWLRELGRRQGSPNCESLWRVVVSVPGIVDERRGRVLFSPNVHWTERSDLIAGLRSLWHLPVEIVQEIGALALGHLMHEPDHRDFLLVDVGEGLGGAIVMNGRPFVNPLPLHGELGHTPITGNPRRCGCGGVGCLETLLSRRSLLESFAASGAVAQPTWEDLVAHVAKEGLPPWLDGALAAAGGVIAGAVNILGLRRVVVTGLLGDLPSVATERLFEAVRRGGLWARFGEIDCLAAPRRRAAGLVAAGIDLFSSATPAGARD